jgi:hypothetical protein
LKQESETEMKDEKLDNFLQEVQKVKKIAKVMERRVRLLATLFIATGFALAFLFRNINSEAQYLTLLGLYSQLIAFAAAVMLSDQFLSLPGKYKKIHGYMVASAMSAPIYIWAGGIIYTIAVIPFDFPYSVIWAKSSMVICLGLGMVLFAAGSIGEALSIDVKDKQASVGTGWYMIVFSISIQIYISLIQLDILTFSLV